MQARRALTIPLYLALTVLLTIFSPALLIGSWLLSWIPGFRGAVPTGLFILSYCWCETAGIAASFYLWLRHRDQDDFLRANYRLQCWWANALKRSAERLFGLQFDISGERALSGQGAIVLPRHTSIADTVIPMVFYAIPRQISLRYVLKKELLFDPCLDIVGNRLPNYFVDRGGQDTSRAIAGVAALMDNLPADAGLLLYLEGTRFTPRKLETLRLRWSTRPELLEQLDRWPHLLPPRLGGIQAVLDANPGRDILFCAHVGFEGSSHFRNLVNGAWRHARIRIHFWRIPFAELPIETTARRDFLFEQWDRMERWVSLHQQADQQTNGG